MPSWRAVKQEIERLSMDEFEKERRVARLTAEIEEPAVTLVEPEPTDFESFAFKYRTMSVEERRIALSKILPDIRDRYIRERLAPNIHIYKHLAQQTGTDFVPVCCA